MIAADSRYANVALVQVVDEAGDAVENLRLDLPYPRPAVTTEQRPSVVTYRVRAGDTWATLAGRFFSGQTHLWWAIAEFSGVIDVFEELSPGRTTPNAKGTLRVPSIDTVLLDMR